MGLILCGICNTNTARPRCADSARGGCRFGAGTYSAHTELTEESKQWRRDEEVASRDRQVMDALESQKMTRENKANETRVQQLGQAADTTIETYEAMVNDPTMQHKMAEHEKHLEVADELERLHVSADAEREVRDPPAPLHLPYSNPL